MSHVFDRSGGNVYADAAHHVDSEVFSSRSGVQSAGQDELYDVLSNAIVVALGDIAAQAYRHGVTGPQQLKGLVRAVSKMSEEVLTSYRGEVDPEGALGAISSDPRLRTLPEEDRLPLSREMDKTRQLEHLLLQARRIPDLIDLAGSLNLHIPDEVLDEGATLMGRPALP